MSEMIKTNGKQLLHEEKKPRTASGMVVLLLNILLMISAVAGFIYPIVRMGEYGAFAGGIGLLIVSVLYLFLIGPVLFAGLKIIKPNEALVLTFFGKYYGTLREEGFFFVNPFAVAVNPGVPNLSIVGAITEVSTPRGKTAAASGIRSLSKKISLKAMTLK